MNTTALIILTIAFYVITEVLTHMFRDEQWVIRFHIGIMRMVVIALPIFGILCLSSSKDSSKYLMESNDFKRELIYQQDSLISMQQAMIDNLANHLWNQHGCDIPDFDGDLYYDMCQKQELVDSLYNTQH